jgi:hypothetical protein
MIISNITKEDIFEKTGFYCDLFEKKKNAIENQDNGRIMLLESRSITVQDEAYFQHF